MVLKLEYVLRENIKHNVCNSVSRAPTFAPMESLKDCRDRFGWTQKYLAALCGVTHSHISHIEHGRTEPSLKLFVKMHEELEVSPRKLLDMLKLHSGKSAAASVTDIQKERERRKRR